MAIITFNEQEHIARCIESVLSIADEIIVIDSYSTDRTKEICLSYNVTYFENKFEGHIEQKNFAIEKAKFPYILSLDADECLEKETIQDIMSVKKEWTYDGYFFNRLNNYCGQWIKNGGWYPDKKLRLWDSRKGKWEGENPHDCFLMDKDAKIHSFKSNILHYTLSSVEDHIKQIEYFTTIAAEASQEKGKKATFIHLLVAPIIKFTKDYFLKTGFMDGVNGFRIARLSAWASYLKYAKLRKLNKG